MIFVKNLFGMINVKNVVGFFIPRQIDNPINIFGRDVKLRKVGNSYVVTIPADFVERFSVSEGDFLAVELDSQEIQKINKRGENAR